MYQVCKAQSMLLEEGLAMIRYHSFYPWHREGVYCLPPYGGEGVRLLCICCCTRPTDAARSYRALKAVHTFNPYDLYSKTDELVDPVKLRPYYESLIAKFFLSEVDW